jgi:hypothetical protein
MKVQSGTLNACVAQKIIESIESIKKEKRKLITIEKFKGQIKEYKNNNNRDIKELDEMFERIIEGD